MRGIHTIYTSGVERSLRNLDLNLLLSLDALLSERNVTRAAERLGLSQPAVSAALARLRRHFGDELLRRNGNRYERTPLGDQLASRTPGAVNAVKRVFDTVPDFDPHTAEREFTLVVSDYGAAVLGDHVATVIGQDAPGVRLRFQQQTPHDVDHAIETLRSVDGMVLPHGFLRDIPVVDLYEDSWVCIVSQDNPRVGDSLTIDDVATLPWVVTYSLPTAFTPASQQLRMIGVEPDIQIVVESFLAVPFLVAGTSRVALLQAELAHRLADAAGVRILACPWDVVPLKEAFWWHPASRTDPAHIWLREVLQQAGRRITADAAIRASGD
jgi:DNA-binding transcriptional LysR family regulator